MENKQTAVEWLIQQLVELDKLLDGRRKNDDATVIKLNPTKIYEQALKMEKEQNQNEFERGYLKCADTLQFILDKGLKNNFNNECINL